MFVLALDEMLRAATGDRAGAPPRDRAPGRAAGGVGGAVGLPRRGARPPSTPARVPASRLPVWPRRPGARGGAPARRPTWSVSPGQGRQHLMGRWAGAVQGEARQADTTAAGHTHKERSKERCITTYDAPLA